MGRASGPAQAECQRPGDIAELDQRPQFVGTSGDSREGRPKLATQRDLLCRRFSGLAGGWKCSVGAGTPLDTYATGYAVQHQSSCRRCAEGILVVVSQWVSGVGSCRLTRLPSQS